MNGKTVSLILGLTAAMIVIATPLRAGEFEPPPEGAMSKGPAISGSVVIQPAASGSGFLDIEFRGKCRGLPVTADLTDVNFPPNDVPSISAANLKNFFLAGVGALVSAQTDGKCATSNDLVTHQVSDFLNTGDVVLADITLLWVIF